MIEKQPAKRISITLDPEVYYKFKFYCKKRGMKVSTKIQALISQELISQKIR